MHIIAMFLRESGDSNRATREAGRSKAQSERGEWRSRERGFYESYGTKEKSARVTESLRLRQNIRNFKKGVH